MKTPVSLKIWADIMTNKTRAIFSSKL